MSLRWLQELGTTEHGAHGTAAEDSAASAIHHAQEEEEDYEHHLIIVAAVTLSMLMFSMLAAYVVGHKWKVTWMPEAGVVLLVGMFFGWIISETDTNMEELHSFKTELVRHFVLARLSFLSNTRVYF